MKVYGIDFTSAPGNRKPLTCAVTELNGQQLVVERICEWADFGGFERLLQSDGEWIVGIDFPFGLPIEFLDDVGWGPTWTQYVAHVAGIGKQAFEEQVRAYGRRLFRRVDRLAQSRSPLQLDFIPVGKMFFQGATRLLASEVDIVPVRRTTAERKVVEAYPALVGDKCGHRNGYKSDSPGKQTPAQRETRQAIVMYLQSDKVYNDYGLHLDSCACQSHMVSDPTGDTLDAVHCALQAAWAYANRDECYGMPDDCSEVEGWIADPCLLCR